MFQNAYKNLLSRKILETGKNSKLLSDKKRCRELVKKCVRTNADKKLP